VHALLGAVELEDSLAEKRHCRQLNEILTHNLIFGNRQKARLAKTPNNQKPTLTNQNAKQANANFDRPKRIDSKTCSPNEKHNIPK